MKRILMPLCLLLVISGCAARTTEKELNQTVFTSADEVWAVDAEETYPDAPGELAVVYDSLEELTEAADEVVRAAVQSVKKDGEEVVTEILVTGVWKYKWPKGLWGGETIMVRDSLPAMERDRTYVLFLEENGEEYRICGVVQGRFIDHGGYLFQQTWESLKLPETPIRTGELEENVRSQTEPFVYEAPPWYVSFNTMEELRKFWAMEDMTEQEFANREGDHLWFHEKADYQRFLDRQLKPLPVPAQTAEEMSYMYAESARTPILLRLESKDSGWQYRVLWDTSMPEIVRLYGRPVEGAEGFWECTDVLAEDSESHSFLGQAEGYWVQVDLYDRTRKEALTWIRETEFCPLGNLVP